MASVARCGHENLADAAFCEECGIVLAPAEIPSERPSAPQLPAGAERRRIVVLMCDLVDSTALTRRLDAEDLREVVRRYQQACASAVERFMGHVAQHLGDGMLVYFGYPCAQEDDAERALHAALRILDAIEALNAQLEPDYGVRIAVRVGVHAGRAVVAEFGARGLGPVLALGEVAGVCERLQAAARPNAVLTTAAVVGLVRHARFSVVAASALFGTAQDAPIATYEVLRTGSAPPAVVAVRRKPIACVGRDAELSALFARYELARAGQGQVVLVTGAPGIGKTRLTRELRARAEADDVAWLECHGTPHSTDSALAPIIELQASEFGLSDRQSAPIDALVKAISPLTPHLPNALCLFADLHSIAIPDDHPLARPPLRMSPEALRRRTIEALRDWLLLQGRERPAVLLVEDLQWVDPSTLELLTLTLAAAHATPILIVLTARPEFEAPFRSEIDLALCLARLTPGDARELIAAANGGRGLAKDLVDEIATKGDGVPLFLVELSKAALELRTPGGPEARAAVPDTLHGLVMARLDRLGSDKEAAQIAAVFGQAVPSTLLSAVWPHDPAALSDALDHLLAAELLHEEADAKRTSYVFKHALVRDAAYDSLVKTRRQQYHERFADAIIRSMPDLSVAQPELVAQHLHGGQRLDRALPYWLAAGRRGMERSAQVEAIRHFRRGLQCAAVLPEGELRARAELALQALLSVSLMAIRGYAADEVIENYAIARSLCERVHDTEAVFPVLFGMWLFHLVRGDRAQTLELLSEVQTLAERSCDDANLVRAHAAGAVTEYYRGNFAQARRHSAEVIARYKKELHGAQLFVYGDDALVHAHMIDALASWFLGFPERALRSMQSAESYARELDHPFTTATVQGFRCQVAQLRGDVDSGASAARQVIAWGNEQGFPFYTAVGVVHSGWPLVLAGNALEGEARMRRGIEGYLATGALTNAGYFHAMVAEACLLRGDAAAAAQALAEADALVSAHLECYFVPDIERLRGELWLLQGADVPRVAAQFEHALQLAAAQEARSLELRAATSLAKLARKAPQLGASARARLAQLLEGFTEGHDTRDLRAAHAILSS